MRLCGDGTFQAAASYSSGGTNPVAVTVGDFNRDGRQDLAVANQGSNSVSILLANADGTSQLAIAISLGSNPNSFPSSVAIGDFNGDGRSDLAVSKEDGTVAIFLGNGDGTFQPAVNYTVSSSGATGVTVGDLNGDGHLDLAVGEGTANMAVLLGNGDGTFPSPVTYALPGINPVDQIATADLNGDGKADLVMVQMLGGVTVLFGNGDGSFQLQPMSYSVPGINPPVQVAVADLNDDGLLDLVAALPGFGSNPGNISVLLNACVSKTWTVMVYLDGDTQINGYASLDSSYVDVFNQLERAANNPHVHIVVAWDRPQPNPAAYYEVQYDTNMNALASYTAYVNMWPQSDLAMNNPTTLSQFITWARTVYSSQYYALFIDDHGTGLYGTAIDASNGGTLLKVSDLGTALNTATQSGTSKIDVVFLDSCLMAMIEDVYQIDNFTNYFVASQNEIWIPGPGNTRPYANYINDISVFTVPSGFAESIVTEYSSWMDSVNAGKAGDAYTISAADLSQINNLANGLSAQVSTYGSQIGTARMAAQKLDSNDNLLPDSGDVYLDLYDLASQISTNISNSTIQSQAQAVMSAVNSYIISQKSHGGSSYDLSRAHGVSIFFPPNASSFYVGTNYAFAQGTTWPGHLSPTAPLSLTTTIAWGPMLVNYFQTTQPGGPDTPNPPPLAAPLLAEQFVFVPYVKR